MSPSASLDLIQRFLKRCALSTAQDWSEDGKFHEGLAGVLTPTISAPEGRGGLVDDVIDIVFNDDGKVSFDSFDDDE